VTQGVSNADNIHLLPALLCNAADSEDAKDDPKQLSVLAKTMPLHAIYMRQKTVISATKYQI